MAPDPRPGPAFRFSDLKAAAKRFSADQVTHQAAAMTYYSLLSLFPALLFAVALLGVFGQQSLVTDAARYLSEAGAEKETVDAVSSAVESAVEQKGTAVTALIFGLVTALWGASGALSAAGVALNVVWRVKEGRSFVKKKLNDLVWTALLLVLVALTMVLIFLGGSLAEDVLGKIGLGSTAATAWTILRWPAATITAMLVYAIVYFAAPNVQVRRFQWITPGAIAGVLIWIAASGLFFLYASNFTDYSATYGAFAGAVFLLMWLWLTNIALLFGAELNAAIDVRRSPGLPATYEGPPLPEKVPAKA